MGIDVTIVGDVFHRFRSRSGDAGRWRVGVEYGLVVVRIDGRVIQLGSFAVFGIGIGEWLLALRRGTRGAEGRHLDDLAAEKHVRQAEPPPNQAAVPEEPLHLFRQRIGRNIEVLRIDTQQEIPDASPDEECHESAVPQPV